MVLTRAGGCCEQSGLADIRAWVSYMGAAWCGEVADAEAALEHSSQAVRYLLVGKDDCVRKATKVCACVLVHSAFPHPGSLHPTWTRTAASSAHHSVAALPGSCCGGCLCLQVQALVLLCTVETSGLLVMPFTASGLRSGNVGVLTQGFDITPDLRRMCPSLTLQQIYKLTEHHHDDWITTGSQTTDILVLLQTLKRIVDNTVRGPGPLHTFLLQYLEANLPIRIQRNECVCWRLILCIARSAGTLTA